MVEHTLVKTVGPYNFYLSTGHGRGRVELLVNGFCFARAVRSREKALVWAEAYVEQWTLEEIREWFANLLEQKKNELNELTLEVAQLSSLAAPVGGAK